MRSQLWFGFIKTLTEALSTHQCFVLLWSLLLCSLTLKIIVGTMRIDFKNRWYNYIAADRFIGSNSIIVNGCCGFIK